MSLYVGEAGDSGMSGSSSPSASSSLLLSSPSRGGAPSAADARWGGLGRGVSSGNTLRDTILGGHSGRGAAAGVVGVEVLKVLTDTSSSPKVVTVEISLPGVRKTNQSRYCCLYIHLFLILVSLWPYVPSKRRNGVGANNPSGVSTRIISLVGQRGSGGQRTWWF